MNVENAAGIAVVSAMLLNVSRKSPIGIDPGRKSTEANFPSAAPREPFQPAAVAIVFDDQVVGV